MKRIARLIERLHRSRTLEADRVIRRYWRLVEEAHAHDRKREAEAAQKNVERVLERAFITG
jgi:hypothetical protein